MIEDRYVYNKNKINSNVIKLCILIISIINICMLTGCKKDEIYDSDKAMNIEFLSVGKADSILIRMGDCIILNDCGDTDGVKIIKAALDKYKITDIDYMILSHYDSDHIAGANNIIKDYNVKEVIGPNYVRESNHYENLVEAIEDSGVTFTKLTKDYYIEKEQGRIYINVPDNETYDNDDNYSLITALYYGDKSFLLMGDAMKERCQEFNAVCADKFDLVKIPHHGDYNKALKNMLNNCGAEYSIITTSDMSTVEDKISDVIDELELQNYYTFNGNIIATTDGTKIEVKQDK